MSLLSNVYSVSTVAGYEGCPLPPPNAEPLLERLGIQLPPIVSELQTHQRMEGRVQSINRMLEASTDDRLFALGKTILLTSFVAAFVLGCVFMSTPATLGLGLGFAIPGLFFYLLSSIACAMGENVRNTNLEIFLGERGSYFRDCFFESRLSFLTAFLVVPHLVFPLWSAFSRHEMLENARTRLAAQMTEKATEIQNLTLDQESIESLENREKLEQLMRACNETIRIFEADEPPVDADSVQEIPRQLRDNVLLTASEANLVEARAAIEYLQALKTFLQTKIDEAKSA